MAAYSLRSTQVDPNAASYRIEVSETSFDSWFGVRPIPRLTVVIVCEYADDMEAEAKKLWTAARAIGKHCKRALFGRFRRVQIDTVMRLPDDSERLPQANAQSTLRPEHLPLI